MITYYTSRAEPKALSESYKTADSYTPICGDYCTWCGYCIHCITEVHNNTGHVHYIAIADEEAPGWQAKHQEK